MKAAIGIEVDANSIPVREDVKAACETLGMDPLFVANEGKLVAMVERSSAPAVLEAMRSVPQGRQARMIGEVVESHPNMAILKTEIGGAGFTIRRATAAHLLSPAPDCNPHVPAVLRIGN